MARLGGLAIYTAVLGLCACLLQASGAVAAPRPVKDPGSVPQDAFVINDNALRASWPQGNLTRMGNQSPQWKPAPNDPKSYGSTQQFSAYGGSGGLWVYVNAGPAVNEQLKNPGTVKEITLNRVNANRRQNENLKFIKDCSGRGYPHLYHYLSVAEPGPGMTMTSYQEGFHGYAGGYYIWFFFKASQKREYLPPPQWLEGFFFSWLERIPALDGAETGGVAGRAGPGGVSDRQAMAATAAAGAAMAGGLTLQKLLGGGPLPAEGGRSSGGSEAGGSEREERGGRRRYWMTTTAHRRRLKADGKDRVWVYARVETDDPESDPSGLTRSIDFSAGGACGHWLRLGEAQFSGGYAAVPVTALPPEGGGVPSGQAGAAVTARASGPEGGISGSLELVLEAPAAGRIETRTHQDRASLRPDGKDGIWLYAAVVMEGDASEEDRQKANDSLVFSPAGDLPGWVRLGEPQYTGGWKAVFIQAEGQGTAAGGPAPPGKVSVAVRGRAGDQEIGKVVYFDLLSVPVLQADREQVVFSEDSAGPVEVKAYVGNPGPDPWEFQVEFDPGRELFAGAEVRQVGPASAVITLARAAAEGDSGTAGYRRSVLRVSASQKSQSLEKEIAVLLAVEGIEIDHHTYPDRQFRLPGDGKSTVEIDFAVLRRDGSGELVSDAEMVKNLVFEDRSRDTQAINAIRAGELKITFDRLRRLNTVYGVYTFRLGREVPADGRVLPAVIRVHAAGEAEKFSRTFQLGIETTDMSPGSKVWEEEVRRTEEFIARFTPESGRDHFRRILDTRKHTLGVDGLYELRRRIWSAAQDIMLAQGKSYEIEAEWQEYYLNILNWTKWVGDQAFSIVAGSLLGPGLALTACATKDAVVDALARWSAGESFNDYMESRVREVLQGIGEYVVNPDDLKKRFGYAKAYGIYFCWRFMFNLGTNNDEGRPRSAAEAAWQAVKDCATTAVDSWLTNICEKEAIAKGWKKGEGGGQPGGPDSGAQAGRDGGSDPGVDAGAGHRGGKDAGGDPGVSGDAGGKTGGKDTPSSGDAGGFDGKPVDAGESGGDSGETGRKPDRDSGERREEWERKARERREEWGKEAGERREQWRQEAEDRRKK